MILGFEIVMELHYNLKNLMKILTKSTFLRKHTPYPTTFCYSAPFGILWTNIGKFFWPQMELNFFHFFPHYKIHVSPLQNLKNFHPVKFCLLILISFAFNLLYNVACCAKMSIYLKDPLSF